MEDLIIKGRSGTNWEKANMEGLQELLVEELQDLYSAERQVLQALPGIITAAQSEELKAALADHLDATTVHLKRLEDAFAVAGEQPAGKHCSGMEGLLAEGRECIESREPSPLRDLAIISAMQRVALYEVAAYGSACARADNCDLPSCTGLLRETLIEEEAMDQLLTEVSEHIIELSEHTFQEDDVITPSAP